MYSEICGNWRLLTDVRFRLLGLVPPVAGLALVAVVSSGGPLAGVNDVVRVAGAVFGLLITTGLYIYDRRNDELYNDLTSRGRRAEHELGIHTGVFLGRLDVKTRFENKSLIRHGVATGLIYWTVMISWVGAIVYVMAYRP